METPEVDALLSRFYAGSDVLIVDEDFVHTNFALWKVPADGRCLWSSLAVAALDADGADHPLTVDDVKRVARDVRRAISKEMADDNGSLKEPYLSFFAPGDDFTFGYDTPSEYLRALSRGLIFGGPLEIYAFCAITGYGLVVVDASCRGIRAHAYGFRSGHCRALFLLRERSHYDALLPLNITHSREQSTAGTALPHEP